MKRVIAIFILLFSAVAQSRAEQLPIRTYTTAEGLARDQVYKIVTDPRGFLWFCTSDGLSRFDGYEFVNYSVTQGLPHRVVHDLLITRRGDYWAATSAGVRTQQRLLYAQTVRRLRFRKIGKVTSGSVFIGAASRVIAMENLIPLQMLTVCLWA